MPSDLRVQLVLPACRVIKGLQESLEQLALRVRPVLMESRVQPDHRALLELGSLALLGPPVPRVIRVRQESPVQPDLKEMMESPVPQVRKVLREILVRLVPQVRMELRAPLVLRDQRDLKVIKGALESLALLDLKVMMGPREPLVHKVRPAQTE